MPRKILIVDDSPMNRLLLRNVLRDEYDVTEAENGREALALMRGQTKPFSAVLLDIVMPEMDGYEVLLAMRGDPALAPLPVIMVTSSDDEEARVKAVTLGANDYILKPFNPDIVKHCLANNITLHETSSMLKAIQRDRLTGLYTREAFFLKAEELIQNSAPGTYILSCFDIDSFKIVNDQYGAEIGDKVLRHVAEAAGGYIERVGGICCRIADDNFAWLLPRARYDQREMDALHAVMTRPPFINRAVGISVGRYTVDDLSLSVSAIIDRATLAQRIVKGRYGQYVQFYDESMREKLLFDQELVSQMDSALKARQFEVWFQPQRNHATGALIGAEALVRWRHPEKGLIPPVQFIPVFEKNGFIYELDKFVWEESCRYLRKWADEGRAPLPVSVNVSRYDLLRPDIIDVLEGLVAKYAVQTPMLRLEITESAFSESTRTIVRIASQLIDRGFTVEIDDFGSGYSSLNTLKNVPAQVVKLDMRFMEDDDGSGRGGNILESVVRMTKWLGMAVIAEGVEDKAQADYLASIGCNYIQGYLYAKPMPARDYEEYCRGAGKETGLAFMEAMVALDNNTFWDAKSMDTLIFNSYVGAACIFEYYRGRIEMLRATEKHAQMFGEAGITVEDALKLNWAEHLDAETLARVVADLETSVRARKEVTGEYVFLDLPGCPRETYLRSTLRVIATAGERLLVYCANENITAQRSAEARERDAMKRLQIILGSIGSSVQVSSFANGVPRIVFANEQYYAKLGYTKEQYEREAPDPFQFIHADDRARAVSLAEKANEDRQPYALTYRCVRRDGSVYW